MAASIGRSLQQGFRAASRSWLGIAFFAASWVVVALLGAMMVLVTRPPAGVFSGELLEQEAGAPSPTESISPPADDSGASAATEVQETAEPRETEAWFGRAWPLLLVAVLLFIAANVWLTGGQIAYVGKLITSGSARFAEFWTTGLKVFGSLLGAWCLAVFGVGALALVVALLSFLMSLMVGGVPRWVSTAVGVLVGIGLFIAMIWLGVRLLFWFIAVVLDGLGPVAGLKASWRATQGRWWRVAGLGAAVMALSFVVSGVFGLLEWLGGTLGDAGAVLVILSNIAGVVANLFLGFWVTGSFIHYYIDAKSPAASAPSGAV